MIKPMTNDAIKILIVDDEPDIIEFLSYNLKKESYQVFSANNGIQGIEVAKQEKPDMIILDIMMPKMDGIEVCKQLRSIPDFANTVIIFLTAREEDFTQIAALEAGGDDFVNKPIRPRVFITRISALLRRKFRKDEEDEQQIIELGDLLINKTEVKLVLEGKKIDLPKKEFEIIWLLASKPGKVFKRDEIFHKIWGNDVIVGNRTIDVHIRKLREKLGDSIIKTVKGIGYKMEF
jgi:two-component system alkaline phosphatase synthesis response regulator PhoP